MISFASKIVCKKDRLSRNRNTEEIGKFFAIIWLTIVPYIHIDEFLSFELNHIVEHLIVNLCKSGLEDLLENIHRLKRLPT